MSLIKVGTFREFTLGGWLGGSLQWHFAGMWLLAINGLVCLALNVASGRFGADMQVHLVNDGPVTIPMTIR